MDDRTTLPVQTSKAGNAPSPNALIGRPLRIAMLTHSVNPRGGVVHALALSEQLQAFGHDVTLFAPDPHGQGLFRDSGCRFQSIPGPVGGSAIRERVRQRIADYVRFFSAAAAPQFDLYHAQDAISANAMADLAHAGLISGYLRTVHHLDIFEDPQLAAWQERAFRQARVCLCVSQTWRDVLMGQYGVTAQCVANGVDVRRYSAMKEPHDDAVRRRYGLGAGPVFLSVGGMEARKNTLAVIAAFIEIRRTTPDAQLVIAGGASVFDHATYRAECMALLSAHGLMPRVEPTPPTHAGRASDDDIVQAVVITGTVADDDMPCLYRCANALVFPSFKEGFGLVVLEAMASGVPVIVSRIAPFTEYLDEATCMWVDPHDSASIADAMSAVRDPLRREALISAAMRRARDFSWEASAARHIALYRAYLRHFPIQETSDA
jgi:glycosyltransferase-like protein